MITNRHVGLVRVYGAAVLLGVSLFFWGYAEFIMRWIPVVKLSREVNLVPYFLCVVIGLLAGRGRIRRAGSRLTRLSYVEAAGMATTQVVFMALAVFTMMFATQDRSISRLFLGSFLLWTWLGLIGLHRVLPRKIARGLFREGDRIPTLFIGREESLPQLREWLAQSVPMGVLPVGFIAQGSSPAPASGISTTPFLGSLAELPHLLETKSVGQVILLEAPENPETGRQIIAQCQARGCRVLVHHQLDELLGHPVVSVDEGGRHFFTLHEEPLEEPLNRVIKRGFDLMVALPVVVFVLPFLVALVWWKQKRQAPGPLFHVRPRSGERRVEFAMLKFRSMYVPRREGEPVERQAQSGDERIYPFGRFLRRHSLDEFPQFWNVITGEMSLVGPRPVMPWLDAEFAREVQAYRSKHWVKPGITGLAQSEGFRGEIKTPEQLRERIRLDLYYIAHWSPGLDVQITLKTFRQIFFPPKSAY